MTKKAIVALLIFIFVVVLTNFVSNTITILSEEQKYKTQIEESYVEFSQYYAFSDDYSLEPDYSNLDISSDDYVNPLYYAPITFYSLENGDFNYEYSEYFKVDVNNNIKKALEHIDQKVSIFDEIIITPMILDNFYLSNYNVDILVGEKASNTTEIMIDEITAAILYPGVDISEVVGKTISMPTYDVNNKLVGSTDVVITGIYKYDTLYSGSFSTTDSGDILYRTPFVTSLPPIDDYQYKEVFLSYLSEIGYSGYTIFSSDSLNSVDEYHDKSDDLVYKFPTHRLIIPVFQLFISVILLVVIIALSKNYKRYNMKNLIIMFGFIYIAPLITTTFYLSQNLFFVSILAVLLTLIIIVIFFLIAIKFIKNQKLSLN